jgi:hypothetical protein
VIGVTRIACLLAMAVALAVLGTPVPAHAEKAPAAAVNSSSVAPVAIELGEIFGDENEADEDEADEGGSEDGAQSQPQQSSGVSIPALLLLMAVGLAAVLYTRRLLRRFRSWIGDWR